MAVLVNYHKRFLCGMDCRMADYSANVLCLAEQSVLSYDNIFIIPSISGLTALPDVKSWQVPKA